MLIRLFFVTVSFILMPDVACAVTRHVSQKIITATQNSTIHSPSTSKSYEAVQYHRRVRILHCYLNPCLDGRICTDISNGYRCECPDGWIGQNCITRSTCTTNNPCLNEGQCRDNGTNGLECECAEKYYGRHCEHPNPCIPNPCLHAGACSNKFGTFECACLIGFSGDKCELHECNPNPCLHGGACRAVPGTGEHSCFCHNGYLGKNCEYSPCFLDPCLNGGACIANRSSSSYYTCHCVAGWSGETCDTKFPDLHQACDPNPCRNGCQCKPSCRHENGFICVGLEGQLGRNCVLPSPIINCGRSEVTVRIDSRIVDEYSGSLTHGEIFMSNSSSIVTGTKPRCPATRNGTDLEFVVTLPFNKCGTMTYTRPDGTTSVTNTIWMNRLLGEGKFEIPIPIVRFVCQYDVEYNVVTSISPALGYTRLVVGKGKRTLPALLALCKRGDYCPKLCPEAYSVTQGAVYTVGEKLHLRIYPKEKGTILRVQELFLSCEANVSQEQTEAPAVMVASGCLPRRSTRFYSAEVSQHRHGVCVSFQVPLLPECSVFYIHAKLRSCAKDCPSSYKNCSNGRQRRSTPIMESVHVLGPAHLLRGNNGILKTVLYPGDGGLAGSNQSYLTTETSETRNHSNILLKFAVWTVFIVFASFSVTLTYYNCQVMSDKHRQIARV